MYLSTRHHRYGGRHRPRPHCVRSSSPKRGTAPNFRPVSIVDKRSPISATAEHLYNFWGLCRIFRTGGGLQLCTSNLENVLVQISASPSMTNCSKRGVVRVTWRIFKFWALIISLEWLKLDTSNLWCRLSVWLPDKLAPKRGVFRSRDFFKFYEISDIISERIQDRDTVTLED